MPCEEMVSSPLVFEPIYRTVGLPYSQRRQDGPALFPTHLPTLLKSLESHFAFHNQNGPERAIWGAVSTPTALLPFVSLQHEQFCPSAPVCLLFTQEAQITYAGSSDPGDLAKLSSSCLSFPICAVGVLVTASVLWLLPRIE